MNAFFESALEATVNVAANLVHYFSPPPAQNPEEKKIEALNRKIAQVASLLNEMERNKDAYPKLNLRILITHIEDFESAYAKIEDLITNNQDNAAIMKWCATHLTQLLAVKVARSGMLLEMNQGKNPKILAAKVTKLIQAIDQYNTFLETQSKLPESNRSPFNTVTNYLEIYRSSISRSFYPIENPETNELEDLLTGNYIEIAIGDPKTGDLPPLILNAEFPAAANLKFNNGKWEAYAHFTQNIDLLYYGQEAKYNLNGFLLNLNQYILNGELAKSYVKRAKIN